MFHIGFKIREMGLIIEKYIQHEAVQSGLEHLDGPQGAVLFYLTNHEEENIFQKDIEQLLNIQKASASGLIKRMEKNGFIQVEALEHDKRYNVIKVTPAGKAKRQAIEEFANCVETNLITGVSEEELRIFHNVLKKVTHNACLAKEMNKGECEC